MDAAGGASGLPAWPGVRHLPSGRGRPDDPGLVERADRACHRAPRAVGGPAHNGRGGRRRTKGVLTMSLQLELPVRDLPADDLYHASRSPELVRVPELTFARVDGTGHPTASDEFAAAIQALYGISYPLRFGLKRERGLVNRVGPLEGLWWADD